MNSQPTLAAIAAALGVSMMTVSKALRGQGRISRAMCERVCAEAARLGYHPNPHGVGLVKARQGGGCRGALALLVGHHDRNPLTADPPHPLHYHYPRMVEGARTRAAELGYGLDVFWVFTPGLTARRLEAILQARAINAVILMSVQRGSIEIDWSRYACAYLGKPEGPGGAFSFADFFSVARLAFEQAHEAGYRRIGLVMDEVHHQLTEGRCLGGWAAAQTSCMGTERVSALVLAGAAANEVEFRSWLNRERPDVILFLRNRVPEWIKATCQREKERVGLVDLDLRSADGGAAGVWLPHERIGAGGVDLVNDQLQHGQRGLLVDAPVTWLTGDWVNGGTLPPKNISG